jgi:hypothetical protein
MDQEIGGKNRRSTIMRCHSLLIEPLTLDPWRYVTPTPGRYAARGYSALQVCTSVQGKKLNYPVLQLPHLCHHHLLQVHVDGLIPGTNDNAF